MRSTLAFLVVCLLVHPAAAEEATATQSPETAAAAPTDVTADAISALLRAIRLPEAAVAAREAGLPEEQISETLIQAQREAMPASETEVILQEGAKMAREGRAENFGAFVQTKLAEGLRGRDLAEAIRAQKGKAKGPKGERAVLEDDELSTGKVRDPLEAGEKDVRDGKKSAERELKGQGKAKKKAADSADKKDKPDDKPGH